jgi:hypothetical protein
MDFRMLSPTGHNLHGAWERQASAGAGLKGLFDDDELLLTNDKGQISPQLRANEYHWAIGARKRR